VNGRVPVAIVRLATGVPGLDDVLGGGIPEYSFNLIAGPPGTGKTTMANQIVFANASPARPALYFTILGEPPLKMLRYQQQLSFFDPEKINRSIYFINLNERVLDQTLAAVLDIIVGEVKARNPALVIVDAVGNGMRGAATNGPAQDAHERQAFIQRLAVYLTTWQATTFLVGDYEPLTATNNPLFRVADSILLLSQSIDGTSAVRKFQALKVRGQAIQHGLHSLQLDGDGVRILPRAMVPVQPVRRPEGPQRLTLGTPELDDLLGGGVPAGDAVLVAGPSGTGKSVLTTQFIGAGALQNEPGVIAVFDEQPEAYVARAEALGLNLAQLIRTGLVELVFLRPMDLSVDTILLSLQAAAQRVAARRVAIDSLSGFELALAPSHRADVRDSLHRIVASLTGQRMTVWLTANAPGPAAYAQYGQDQYSFLADDVIQLRHVQLQGQLQKLVCVVKMRGSAHSTAIHAYEISARGLHLQVPADRDGQTPTPAPRGFN